MIHFEIPKNQSSIIKVIGVGGGGSNAVNYMHSLGIEGVDFVVCNTDSQALKLSPVANKIQLGPHLTQGLGAGANPEIGKKASEESLEDISKILKVNTRMAFITAGMGGGTGTGGAPVIAKICRELEILTVGIVTLPFKYEGGRRLKQAQEGINRMREHVDTILVINNDKLRQQFGDLAFTKAFAKADDILATAAKCITDVITSTGQINVDFADVCTVMRDGGVAILGSAFGVGENRALHAVENALNSPLLNDSDISGAKWILLNITSTPGEFEHTMDEAEAIQAYVQQQAGESCDVILGMGHDPNLGERISVTVIATGFHHRDIQVEMPEKAKENEKKIVVMLGDKNPNIDNQVNFEQFPQQKVVPNNVPLTVDMPFSKTNWQEPKPEEISYKVYSGNTTTPEPKTPEIPQTNTQQGQLSLREISFAEEPVMKFTTKEETPAETPVQYTFGERILTEDELEEKKRFEEQKRALEERAERLRRVSFNIKNAESSDELESVPAYLRKNVKLDNQNPSTDNYYSGYSVGPNIDRNNPLASIQTINTFLDGNKPD